MHGIRYNKSIMKWYVSTRARLGLALVGASLVSFVLFGIGALQNHAWDFWYINWNLFLAWMPLLLVLWLERILSHKLWSAWPALVVTFLYLVFLPNAFYVTTDIIHLQEAPRVDLIYDVVMFSAFIFTSFFIGLLSIYLLHAQLRKRVSVRLSWTLVLATIFLTSFAIYIGRDLRWNTWDVFLNPASILFEVSDGLIHPGSHPELFSVTFSFFTFITTMYLLTWFAGRTARQQKLLD